MKYILICKEIGICEIENSEWHEYGEGYLESRVICEVDEKFMYKEE